MKRLLHLIILLATLPVAAYGQEITALAEKYNLDEADIRWRLAEDQLVTSLASPVEAIVVQSLDNAIILSIMHRDRMNLARVGKAITKVHRRSQNPETREVALAALLIVGSDHGLAYARGLNRADREASRTLAYSIVDNYFSNSRLMAARPRTR